MLSAGGLLDKITIGNDAGWGLTFHKEKEGRIVEDHVLSLSRDDYFAEISAELPEGLEGGAYAFTLEGITDEHYGQIAQKGDHPTVLRLYMFWRDTNASAGGYLANLAGITDLVGTRFDKEALVAELSIKEVSRQKGARRYEAKIEARERVFQKLNARVSTPVTGDNTLATAEALAKSVNLEVVTNPITPSKYKAPPAPKPGSEKRQEGDRAKGVEIMRTLGRRLEEASGKFGRGMLLIRNGKLYIGERKFPLEGDQKDLTWTTGLVSVETSGFAEAEVAEEPKKAGAQPAKPDEKGPPKRKKFKLTLKGRPDIKPGDLVKFDPPPEDVQTTLGSWTGVVGDLIKGPLVATDEMKNPTNLYVASVTHKLGRKSGFSTVVTGVEIKDPADPWDKGPTATPVSDSTPEGRAVIAMQKQVKGLLEGQRFDEVAEVRAMTVSGEAEPPRQTLLLWRGLAASDGSPNQGRRLPIARPSTAPAAGSAYLSPFAWGKCGLVLPRYPGTRVLVSHRGGERDDAIDVGALWESGKGPDSQPGDWWLILPIGVPQSERQTLADEATPKEHSGTVSQDLIDADGTRIIEAGDFTLRIGRGAMKSAGARPSRGEADSITIEHSDAGSKIVMKKDGTISIEGKNIEMKATSNISLDAVNVNVSVSGSMNVS
jgi:hypothetical protein